jgi:hypothetical protein
MARIFWSQLVVRFQYKWLPIWSIIITIIAIFDSDLFRLTTADFSVRRGNVCTRGKHEIN